MEGLGFKGWGFDDWEFEFGVCENLTSVCHFYLKSLPILTRNSVHTIFTLYLCYNSYASLY